MSPRIFNPAMGQPPQQMQMNVDISQTNPKACSECQGIYYVPVFQVREVSPIITGTPEPVFIPLQLWQCINCGNIDLPPKLKPNDAVLKEGGD